MRNKFIKATLIRAIRTMCQTAVATIGAAFCLSDVDWRVVLCASLLAGILSILTSISTGLPETKYEMALHMNHDEPEDSEVKEDDD